MWLIIVEALVKGLQDGICFLLCSKMAYICSKFIYFTKVYFFSTTLMDIHLFFKDIHSFTNMISLVLHFF